MQPVKMCKEVKLDALLAKTNTTVLRQTVTKTVKTTVMFVTRRGTL